MTIDIFFTQIQPDFSIYISNGITFKMTSKIIKSILQDILHFSDLKILLSTKSKSEDLVNACNKPFFVEGYKFHRLRNEFFMP